MEITPLLVGSELYISIPTLKNLLFEDKECLKDKKEVIDYIENLKNRIDFVESNSRIRM